MNHKKLLNVALRAGKGSMGMQGITELFHPWARKSFYWMPCRRQKVFEKIQGIGINEEVGIRMFSLSQMTKVKLVCALAWRENFAKGNNSVTDTKRRMRDSPTLRQSTSWPSDGEGHARWHRFIPLSERSMVNEECPSTRKGTMQ